MCQTSRTGFLSDPPVWATKHSWHLVCSLFPLANLSLALALPDAARQTSRDNPALSRLLQQVCTCVDTILLDAVSSARQYSSFSLRALSNFSGDLSNQHHHFKNQPRPATLRKYGQHLKRLLILTIRVARYSYLAPGAFSLSPSQTSAVDALISASLHADSDGVQLREPVLMLGVSLILDHVERAAAVSVTIFLAGTCMVNLKTRAWHDPLVFTSALSAIIYCA